MSDDTPKWLRPGCRHFDYYKRVWNGGTCELTNKEWELMLVLHGENGKRWKYFYHSDIVLPGECKVEAEFRVEDDQ